MTFITDMKDSDHIIGHYYCKFKQTLKTKAGKSYYSMKLQDKTGVIDAKVWDITSEIQDFDEGEMIKIDADALLYQGEMQMKIYRLRRSRDGEYELADFVPVSTTISVKCTHSLPLILTKWKTPLSKPCWKIS